ncbi:MAG: hypothetical protein C0603_06545 [Denitrovibrio sp.]|nr:MAG: hypothetical protein C0603_06545 [Denitrovibrio sp.]
MERQIITKKRYYLLFAIYFLAFGIIVALLTSFINYQVRYTDIEKQLQTRAVAESHSKRQYIKDYVSQIEMLLLSIANNDLSKKYIETGNEDDRENLNSLFYSLTYSNKDLMQLRFIDTQGFEKVRIDRDKKSPALMIIPADKMQNKANRYYFKEASQIINNAFWHSNIDLNVEHGQI